MKQIGIIIIQGIIAQIKNIPRNNNNNNKIHKDNLF